MAGAGYKLFNTGDVLTAAQVNTYLMEQSVMVFADAAARTTALTGVVAEGMLSYLKDTNAVEVYDGANWVASDDPNAIQNTIVDAKGDLISATGNDVPARLAVGANDLVLTAASGETTGLKWSGAGADYTPTWTNFTVGNASVTVARYLQVGKLVFGYIRYVLGSTSAMGTSPFFTLPVTSISAAASTPLGSLYYEDAGIAGYIGSLNHRSTTTASLNAIAANGTYLGGLAGFQATVPFTWGTGDIFTGYFSYEAA